MLSFIKPAVLAIVVAGGALFADAPKAEAGGWGISFYGGGYPSYGYGSPYYGGYGGYGYRSYYGYNPGFTYYRSYSPWSGYGGGHHHHHHHCR
jgi:hypothetical protein